MKTITIHFNYKFKIISTGGVFSTNGGVFSTNGGVFSTNGGVFSTK